MRANTGRSRNIESDRSARMLTIVTLTVVLVVIGTLFVLNTSFSRGANSELKEIGTQLICAGAGAALVYLVFGIFRFSLENTKSAKWFTIICGIGLFCIIAPRIPGLGVERNGAWRWIGRDPFVVQPSEFLKLLMIFALAAVLEPLGNARHAVSKPQPLFNGGAIAIFGIICLGLIAFQDDLGTAVVMGTIGIVMWIIAGANLKLVGSILGVAGLGFLWAIQEPYRMARLLVWWDPMKHLGDKGMQTAETLMGIGSAGWLGVSWGQGRLKWNIPAANTDYAFASIVEELGFFGAMIFACLVFALAYNCILGAVRHAKSRYTMLIGVGIGLWLMLQTGLNMLVILNVLPPTGFPLPFASSGGTAILMNVIAIGIACAVIYGEAPPKRMATNRQSIQTTSKSPQRGRAHR